MISYWADANGAFGIESYLATRGALIAERFLPRQYEDLAESFEVHRGPQIFSAIDQLTEGQRAALDIAWDQIESTAPDLPLLNHPGRVLHRYQLLQRLHAKGLNAFRAHRATDLDAVERFPVFVREESKHTGAITGLLESRSQVERALRRLRMRGRRNRSLLVVEYCDTADAEGVFRKYAAYRVGEAIVPAHVMLSRHWVVKSDRSFRTVESATEDLHFVRDDPHAAWLRNVFTAARVQFGRVDYGTLNGMPQAWEINLNPTMSYTPGHQRRDDDPEVASIRQEARELAHRKLREAFCALDAPRTGGPLTLHLPKPLLARIDTEARRERRREAVTSFFRRMYDHPVIGRPARAAYQKLFTRA